MMLVVARSISVNNDCQISKEKKQKERIPGARAYASRAPSFTVAVGYYGGSDHGGGRSVNKS